MAPGSSPGRCTLFGNIFFFLTLLVIDWHLIAKHGVAGAATGWAITNAMYAIVWTSVVHSALKLKLGLRWLVFDVFLPAIPVWVVGYLTSNNTIGGSRFLDGVSVGIVFLATGITAYYQHQLFKPKRDSLLSA